MPKKKNPWLICWKPKGARDTEYAPVVSGRVYGNYNDAAIHLTNWRKTSVYSEYKNCILKPIRFERAYV